MPIHFSGNCVCVCGMEGCSWWLSFSLKKKNLRVVLGSWQYSQRCLHALWSHICMAYLATPPAREVYLLQLVNQHWHVSTPSPPSVMELSWSHALYALGEVHMLTASENISTVLMVLVTHSLCLSLPTPPSHPLQLPFSSLLFPLHSSPIDPWRPLFGFHTDFSQFSEQFQLYMLALYTCLFLHSENDSIKSMLHLYPRGECFEEE